MIDLYRKKAFSTRACRWYPDAFFQRRRPISWTAAIVRSRALDRGPCRDTLAVLVGGTTTVAPRRWCAETSVRRGPGHRDGRRGMIST